VQKKSNRVEPSITSEAPPSVPKAKFFEATSSLKSAFDSIDAPFNLFGNNSAEISEQSAANADDDDDDRRSDAEVAAGKITLCHVGLPCVGSEL